MAALPFDGVYRSTDAGTTWTLATTQKGLNQIHSLTANGSTFLAGTLNTGVYRSTDGGDHWTAATTQPTNLRILSLAATGSTLLAGTGGAGSSAP